MELNSEESDTAKVHLHGYARRHWKLFNTTEWARRTLIKTEWAWHAFVPNVQLPKIKVNAHPMKAFSGGLYYVLAPKIGSVFRQSNMTIWKEPLDGGMCPSGGVSLRLSTIMYRRLTSA